MTELYTALLVLSHVTVRQTEAECIKILSAHYPICEWIVSKALPLQNT